MRTPAALRAIEAAPALASLRDVRLQRLATAVQSCGPNPQCHVDAIKWSDADIASAEQSLRGLVVADAGLRSLVSETLIPTGMFQRYGTQDPATLAGLAWRDAAAAMNRIADVYAVGKPPLYPAIDSVSYDPNSDPYRRLIDLTVAVMHEQRDQLKTFYDPSLAFARRLLDTNRRDEAARFEPLHAGENGPAFRRIGGVDWSRYKYRRSWCQALGPTARTWRSIRMPSSAWSWPSPVTAQVWRPSSSSRAVTCTQTRHALTKPSR